MDKLNVFNFYYKKIDTLNYYTIALKKISKNICPDVFEAYHAHYLKIEKTFEFYAQLEEYLKLPLLANEFSRQNECYKFINNRKTIDENHKKILSIIEKGSYIKRVYNEYYNMVDKSYTINATSQKLFPILDIQNQIINADWSNIKKIDKTAKKQKLTNIEDILNQGPNRTIDEMLKDWEKDCDEYLKIQKNIDAGIIAKDSEEAERLGELWVDIKQSWNDLDEYKSDFTSVQNEKYKSIVAKIDKIMEAWQ